MAVHSLVNTASSASGTAVGEPKHQCLQYCAVEGGTVTVLFLCSELTRQQLALNVVFKLYNTAASTLLQI
jgi:hypothetical protein